MLQRLHILTRCLTHLSWLLLMWEEQLDETPDLLYFKVCRLKPDTLQRGPTLKEGICLADIRQNCQILRLCFLLNLSAERGGVGRFKVWITARYLQFLSLSGALAVRLNLINTQKKKKKEKRSYLFFSIFSFYLFFAVFQKKIFSILLYYMYLTAVITVYFTTVEFRFFFFFT